MFVRSRRVHGLDLLNDVYVLLGEIQKTCFLGSLSSYINLAFIYEQWLVITAS